MAASPGEIDNARKPIHAVDLAPAPPNDGVAEKDGGLSYEAAKGNTLSKDFMKIQAICARELLALEPPEVHARLKQEIDEEHVVLVEKHDEALEGLPALDEEGLEEARAQFSGIVGPLLDGLAAHTGYQISLLAGQVKKEGGGLDIECMSIHSNVKSTTLPELDFSRANPVVYADVMRAFSKFVWNTNEYRGGRVLSGPAGLGVQSGADFNSGAMSTPQTAPLGQQDTAPLHAAPQGQQDAAPHPPQPLPETTTQSAPLGDSFTDEEL
ncbi:hypothetical protein K438DRAFT_1995107 [Mycena galopus ATCC 62051]|nr:hypothetical protein K438DRAFT_1995107 [Mycena galopus ATCC 62051]